MAGDAPAGARGAAPERGSATASLSGGQRGGGRTGVTGTASAPVRSRGQKRGRALLAPLSAPQRMDAAQSKPFPRSTFSSLGGEDEAICWKPHSPRCSAPLQQSLLAVLTPWLMGKSSVSPLLAAGKFLLMGCWVPQAMDSVSTGLLAQRQEQLRPRREGSGPAPTSARANCNLS